MVIDIESYGNLKFVPATRNAAQKNFNLMDVYFQHDGASAHLSQVVRTFLNDLFPHRRFGRSGPIHRPARSPDFSLWGYLKDRVSQTAPENLKDLRNRISENCQGLNINLQKV